MSQSANLAQLLAKQSSILLDFDGPICGIFANYPASGVAESLRTTLRGEGIDIPPAVLNERDPLEVLRWAGALGAPEVVQLVDTKLCAEEFSAARTASATPYGREVIIAAYEAGKPTAIVSNNSADAIKAYLHRQRLSVYAMPISGRAFAQPSLMKPNPEPIFRAAKSVGAAPDDCLLIGDSLADILGAKAAELPVIGYANRPEKVERFIEAGADAVVTTMADVACALIEMKL